MAAGMNQPTNHDGHVDADLVKGRMRFIGAARRHLEEQAYQEVQTPMLHHRLGGFEKGTGFSTFSSSLGERLWLRAAPELYLKRLMIDCQGAGMERLFEMAVCLRDDYDESAPLESFDRPEFTLLEMYSTEDDPWALERLLRGLVEQAVAAVESQGLATAAAKQAQAQLRQPWVRKEFSELLRGVDRSFDLEGLLAQSWAEVEREGGSAAERQARAIAARANDARLREASANLAYQAGNLGPYLRAGPQGYWYDSVEHAFRTKVAPKLAGPVLVHRMPLESSPLAQSSDGIHCDKWELYVHGVRVALGQRELMDAQAQQVRFQHIDRLRRLGYDLLPEPDEGFLKKLEQWPAGKPLIGSGVYLDRLAGYALGLLEDGARGQERMVPNLFKSY